MSRSVKRASANSDDDGGPARCVLTPVIDKRICRIMGGTPLPLDLSPQVENRSGGILGPISRAQLMDVVSEPGIANLEDPDERKVWIWDL